MQATETLLLLLQAFVPQLLGRMRVTAYITGNIGTAAAADLAKHVQSLLAEQLKTQPPFSSQVGGLAAGSHFRAVSSFVPEHQHVGS